MSRDMLVLDGGAGSGLLRVGQGLSDQRRRGWIVRMNLFAPGGRDQDRRGGLTMPAKASNGPPPEVKSHFLDAGSIRYCIASLETWGHGPKGILWAACVPLSERWNAVKEYGPECPHKQSCPCDIHHRLKCGEAGFMRYHNTYLIDDVWDWKMRRRWSPEAKARLRLGNLKKRVEKRESLFADWSIEREVARKPDYFDPEKIAEQPDIEAELEAEMADWWERVRADDMPEMPVVENSVAPGAKKE